MTTIRTRLDLDSRPLADEIASATGAKQRDACLAVCKLVVDRTGLDDSLVAAALRTLESGTYKDASITVPLQALVDDLDAKYFAAHDSYEEGRGDQATYRALFAKARAADAVLLAFNDDPFAAAAETTYEAQAAMQWQEVQAVVREALKA